MNLWKLLLGVATEDAIPFGGLCIALINEAD
jgi:hypothetical protein